MRHSDVKKFGTFEGVFTPTILTIIGIIMYLRLGWVVGSVGLGGTMLIILLAHIATIITGLSMASLATNIRVGAGGFYSMISRSLGLEAGGAIGIPLYLSQAFSAALYVIGFTETWLSFFPHHPSKVVATICFIILIIFSLLGMKIVMKLQYLILVAIVLSLLSFFFGIAGDFRLVPMDFFQSGEISFWGVFAIFFPAVTGISAGAAMSGDLRNPKRSLPFGILAAIFVGMAIYMLVAYGYAVAESEEGLRINSMVMKEKAAVPSIVIMGIMGATISSALGSLLASPRILMALGKDKLIPFGKILRLRTQKGEPQIALLFTALIVEASLLLGDLNSIASLLTMFFLITYGSINFVVFIEKMIASPSFRPTFNVSWWIPLIGAVWCTAIMFLINWFFALVAYLIIFTVYFVQIRRNLESNWGDARSGFFNMLGEWALKMAMKLPQGGKNWKPNFLVPIEDPEKFSHQMDFIRDIVLPRGTLRIFSIYITQNSITRHLQSAFTSFEDIIQKRKKKRKKNLISLERNLNKLMDPLQKEGIFAVQRVIQTKDFAEGFNIATQIMKGVFLPPNIVFLTLSRDTSKDDRLKEMIDVVSHAELGLILLADKKKKRGFNKKENINLWIREGSPNLNLSVLTAVLLDKNWRGFIRLISVVDHRSEIKERETHLFKVTERARMPRETKVEVLTGNFDRLFKKAPVSDVNIFGAPRLLDLKNIRHITDLSPTPCLFIRESGVESFMV